MTYNYTTMFPFERNFDPNVSTVWMQANWGHSLTLSALYMACILLGERWMLNRKPWEMRRSLVWWSGALAIFSIVGTIRLTPHFVSTLYTHGFYHSICVMDFTQTVTGFWTQMFSFSKALELLDTAFIVLRKRPLILLHWYHHVTVLVYTWHAYKDHTAAGRWFVFMNYVVHACMYSYYALKASGFRPPKFVSMTLTTMQISQMIAGCFVVGSVFYAKTVKELPCQQTMECLYFSFFIYTTYFALFVHFFYNAYVKKDNKYVDAKKSDKKMHVTNGTVKHESNGVVGDASAKKRQ